MTKFQEMKAMLKIDTSSWRGADSRGCDHCKNGKVQVTSGSRFITVYTCEHEVDFVNSCISRAALSDRVAKTRTWTMTDAQKAQGAYSGSEIKICKEVR